MRRLARLAVLVPFAALLHSPSPALAQVSLGAAEDVAVLAGSAVTCTDSMVTANVAIYPGTAVTQTRCTIPGGTVHVGDPVAQQAYDDFLLAYADIAARPCGTLLTVLSGQTLLPGVYCVSAAVTETGGVLTLDGSSRDTWIFKIGTSGTGALTGTNFSVVMTGGETPTSPSPRHSCRGPVGAFSPRALCTSVFPSAPCRSGWAAASRATGPQDSFRSP